MSKLDDLINKLCPDGVEYISLENCCDYVDYRGKTPKKTDSGIFLITAKNIRQGYIDYESSKEYVSPDDYEEIMHRGLPEIGDVLFTTEAPCGFVAQINNDKVALAQRVIKYRGHKEILNNSFLKYVLLGKEFQTKLHKMSTGSTVEGIKGSRLHKMEIPVPPLEVQNEIVRILDNFSSLEVELEAELEARKKQYEYYRDLLTEQNHYDLVSLSDITTSVSEKNKGQKCKLAYSITKGGLVPTSEYFKDAKVTSDDTSGYKIVKKNWFVYSPSRIDVGSINFHRKDEDVIVSPLNVVFKINEDRIDPKYLLFFLLSHKGMFQILNKRLGIEGTGRKMLPYENFSKIKIPLPSLSEQQRIVSILNHFESLCNDINYGLPAEIEARHKQYEYYRDKLLNFKKKDA